MTTEEFIKEAKLVHGNKYDYSKSEYIDKKTKICIICPEHGEFWQDYRHHVKLKQGCKKCANKMSSKRQAMNVEEFIKRSKEIHGDKYDYSKVEYINQGTPVCIICPEHGEFWQRPNNHLSGKGCHYCRGNKISLSKRLSTEEFIKRAKEIHGDKYDYSKVIYKNLKYRVCIICPEHGEFWQSPDMHAGRGDGCPACGRKKLADLQFVPFEEFLNRAKKIHGDRYEYLKETYNGITSKIDIICKIHGKFSQLAANHLKGQGCPICRSSKLELEIQKFLTDNNIEFIRQKTFDWLVNIDKLKLDFYLPKYNIAIECQGIQHYLPIPFYGGEAGLKRCKEMDNIKLNLCKQHGVKILYYSNLNIEYPYFTYTDKNHLLHDILLNS